MQPSSLSYFTTPTPTFSNTTSLTTSIEKASIELRNLKKIKKVPGKFKEIINSKIGLAKDLKHILGCLKKFELADKEEKSEIISEILEDELVNEFLVKIFVALKNSGLVNPIIEYSLTDDEVRAGLIDITIKLIEADVIPYTEIFTALRESSLALDVVKFLLTDPETREGAVKFVVELLPELIEADIPLKSALSGIARTVTVCPEPTTVTTSTRAVPLGVKAAVPQTLFMNATELI